MKKDQIDAFGKTSADLAVSGLATVLIVTAAKAVMDLFQQKKGLSLTHQENIYAFLDSNGYILTETINKNGQGVLVARNYKSSDGTTYQENSKGWYRKDGYDWIPVNI